MISLLCRNRFLALVVENHTKPDIIVFLSSLIFFDFLTFCQIFCPELEICSYVFGNLFIVDDGSKEFFKLTFLFS